MNIVNARVTATVQQRLTEYIRIPKGVAAVGKLTDRILCLRIAPKSQFGSFVCSVLLYKDLNTRCVKPPFAKLRAYLEADDFRSADVNKLNG